jgi:predicted porin
MKLHLITLALTTLPVAALADVSLYGTLQSTLGRHAQSSMPGNNMLGDTGSRVGIKGMEYLSDGQKVIWQVESRVHLDGAHEKDTFGSRETFVGLEDKDLGKLRIGYINSALKDMYTVDQWKYAGHIKKNIDNGEQHLNSGVNGLAVLSNHSKRLKNAIRYDTPSAGGFDGSIAYGFGGNKTRESGNESVTHASDIVSLGLNYRHGAGFISYGFDREVNPNGLKKDADGKFKASAQTGSSIRPATIHYVEAGYKDDVYFFGVAFQQANGYDWTDGLSGDSKSNFGSGSTPLSPAQVELKTRQAALSAAYTTGAYKPKISFAKGWDQRVAGKRLEHSGYHQVVAGVDYRHSKRTISGLSYGRLTFDRNAHAAVDQRSTTLSTLALMLNHSL